MPQAVGAFCGCASLVGRSYCCASVCPDFAVGMAQAVIALKLRLISLSLFLRASVCFCVCVRVSVTFYAACCSHWNLQLRRPTRYLRNTHSLQGCAIGTACLFFFFSPVSMCCDIFMNRHACAMLSLFFFLFNFSCLF